MIIIQNASRISWIKLDLHVMIQISAWDLFHTHFKSMEDILICLKYYCFVDTLKQECIPVGCIPSAAVSVGGGLPQGGVCPRGFLPGVCLPSGMSAWGVSVWGGVCLGVYPLRPRGRYCPLDPETNTPSTSRGRHPLWSEFLTHACENITFPQLLTKHFPNWQ